MIFLQTIKAERQSAHPFRAPATRHYSPSSWSPHHWPILTYSPGDATCTSAAADPTCYCFLELGGWPLGSNSIIIVLLISVRLTRSLKSGLLFVIFCSRKLNNIRVSDDKHDMVCAMGNLPIMRKVHVQSIWDAVDVNCLRNMEGYSPSQPTKSP